MYQKLSFLLLVGYATTAAAGDVDYVRDVYPILEAHCVGCHTNDEAQGGFVIEDFAKLLSGGEHGIAVTPGTSASSRMFLMAAGKLEPVMPPDDVQGPSADELQLIAKWIDEGAIGPAGDLPIKRTLSVPDIQPRTEALPVTAIAGSRDGRHHAAASFNRISIFDGSDRLATSIDGEFGKVNSMQFSRDGQRLLIGSGMTGAYGLAAIYNVADGKMLREFVGHSDVLYSAIWSPDETLLATAGYDRDILIWNVDSGETVGALTGHNGAIFDLAFSPNGRLILSACADETAKVWNIEQLQRLDTLGQPEGEVYAVTFTPDGTAMVAASADNRLRVWQLDSTDVPRINPIVATRFVDDSPLVDFAFNSDGSLLIVASGAGRLKVLRTADWTPIRELEAAPDTISDLYVAADDSNVTVSLMNGEVIRRELPDDLVPQDSYTQEPHDGPQPDDQPPRSFVAVNGSRTVAAATYLDLGQPTEVKETDLQFSASGLTSDIAVAKVQRNVLIAGAIGSDGDSDHYRFHAAAGEVWAIDADPTDGSDLDPIATVLDSDGKPVVRTRMQAVRDTYFTFRGKDSSQSGDFRIFNWEEVNLDDYLYAAGEITRMWRAPRGPDSGFIVYPGDGDRQTFFGTSHITHALGEPAYVVRPLQTGETPQPNGLPVFDLVYENDDDPTRRDGRSSRLIFTAPKNGDYIIRIADTRGIGSPTSTYRLEIRPANPSFVPKRGDLNSTLHPGTGREFELSVDRVDEYEGAITFDIQNLPEGLESNFPVVLERGQNKAIGMIFCPKDVAGLSSEVQPEIVASARINGRTVQRSVEAIGGLKLGDAPKTIPTIRPAGWSAKDAMSDDPNWTLVVPRGRTVPVQLVLQRSEGFDEEVRMTGNEMSGRNLPFGVYVANTGLSGLLVLPGEDNQEFFITADPVAEPGQRLFHLTAEHDGKVTTRPIRIEIR